MQQTALSWDAIVEEVLARLGRNNTLYDQMDKPRLVRFLTRNPAYVPGPNGTPKWIPPHEKSGLTASDIDRVVLTSSSVQHAAARVISMVQKGHDVLSELTPETREMVYKEVEERMTKLAETLTAHHQKTLEEEIRRVRSGKNPHMEPEPDRSTEPTDIRRSKVSKAGLNSVTRLGIEKTLELERTVREWAEQQGIAYPLTKHGKLGYMAFMKLWRLWNKAQISAGLVAVAEPALTDAAAQV